MFIKRTESWVEDWWIEGWMKIYFQIMTPFTAPYYFFFIISSLLVSRSILVNCYLSKELINFERYILIRFLNCMRILVGELTHLYTSNLLLNQFHLKPNIRFPLTSQIRHLTLSVYILFSFLGCLYFDTIWLNIIYKYHCLTHFNWFIEIRWIYS